MMFRSINISNLLLTKEKEVVANILRYDYVNKVFVAQVDEQRAQIALDDISLYQNKLHTEEDIERLYFHRLLGSQVKCLVKSYNKKDGYILSRADLMKKHIDKFQKGDVVEATVVSASSKALYLEFDEGLSGILYLNQLTSSKVRKPLDIYNIGDKIRCKIIKKKDIFFELSRIELYKSSNFSIENGNLIQCKITKKLDDNSGYFVEVIENPLYSGIFNANKYNPEKCYMIGDEIKLRVAEVDGRKLHLRTYC